MIGFSSLTVTYVIAEMTNEAKVGGHEKSTSPARASEVLQAPSVNSGHRAKVNVRVPRTSKHL